MERGAASVRLRGSSRGGAKGRAWRIIRGMKVRQPHRAQLLGQVPLFSYCSQRELAKVAKLANELELPAGHTLIHEDAEVATVTLTAPSRLLSISGAQLPAVADDVARDPVQAARGAGGAARTGDDIVGRSARRGLFC
jgi:hypothetical protein